MSGFSDYDRYDAVGLAELVRTKKVSPRNCSTRRSNGSSA